jgi:thiol-disulfide isomerase/thioredoxin
MDESSRAGNESPAEHSSTHWSLWLLLVAAVVLLIVVRSRHGPADPLLDRPLPPLEVAGWLNADAPPTAASLRGQVVLIDFWATWCPPCVAQLPDLAKFYERYHDQGLVLLGLTAEPPQELPSIQALVERIDGMNWPIGYGATIPTDIMGIEGFPTLVLFDRSGKSVWVGLGQHRGLDEAIAHALAEE